MTQLPGPRLLADIGGTCARFTIEASAGVFEHTAWLRCAEHASLAALPASTAGALPRLTSHSRQGHARRAADRIPGSEERCDGAPRQARSAALAAQWRQATALILQQG